MKRSAENSRSPSISTQSVFKKVAPLNLNQCKQQDEKDGEDNNADRPNMRSPLRADPSKAFSSDRSAGDRNHASSQMMHAKTANKLSPRLVTKGTEVNKEFTEKSVDID